MHDITQAVFSGTSLEQDLRKLEVKCCSYATIKACRLDVVSIAGQQVTATSCDIELKGAVSLQTLLLFNPTIHVGGGGRLDTESGILRLTSVQVINDFHGILTKIAEWAGFSVGRELRLNGEAIACIREATANAQAGV